MRTIFPFFDLFANCSSRSALHWLLLIVAALSVTLLEKGLSVYSAERPNIILIMADDMD